MNLRNIYFFIIFLLTFSCSHLGIKSTQNNDTKCLSEECYQQTINDINEKVLKNKILIEDYENNSQKYGVFGLYLESYTRGNLSYYEKLLEEVIIEFENFKKGK